MSDEDGAIPEDEYDNWDSGPFCVHWGDPADCDAPCECGHPCCSHLGGHDKCRMCVCGGFVDAKERP